MMTVTTKTLKLFFAAMALGSIVVSAEETTTTTQEFEGEGTTDRGDIETASIQVPVSTGSCLATIDGSGKVCHSMTGEMDD